MTVCHSADLIFSGKFEEYEKKVFSWKNFSVSATKLSLSKGEIRDFNSTVSKQEEPPVPKIAPR